MSGPYASLIVFFSWDIDGRKSRKILTTLDLPTDKKSKSSLGEFGLNDGQTTFCNFILPSFPSRHHGHRRSSSLLSTAHIDFTTERLMSIQVDRDRHIDVSVVNTDRRRDEQQQ